MCEKRVKGANMSGGGLFLGVCVCVGGGGECEGGGGVRG